jgi:hypothetical protein
LQCASRLTYRSRHLLAHHRVLPSVKGLLHLVKPLPKKAGLVKKRKIQILVMRISQKEDDSMESDPVIFILVIQRHVGLTKVKYF